MSPLGRRQRNDAERVARLSSRESAAPANSLQHTQTRLHYHHLLMLFPERSEQLFSDSATRPTQPPALSPTPSESDAASAVTSAVLLAGGRCCENRTGSSQEARGISASPACKACARKCRRRL